MRRRRGCIVVAGVGLLLVCAAGAYVLWLMRGPPDSWRNPPLYPGAQQVAVDDFGTPGRFHPGGNGVVAVKIIRLTSADAPEQVRAFYERAYDGWDREPDGRGNVLDHRNALDFSWVTHAHPPRSTSSPSGRTPARTAGRTRRSA